jgi:uncharacterized UPF0160 family protein
MHPPCDFRTVAGGLSRRPPSPVEVVQVALVVGTHSGTFHADDVLAFAMIRRFVDPDAQVIRTRERADLLACDIVIDVGGEFDPEKLRFDHHQGTYRGPRSSAGMILDWLEGQATVDHDLATLLRARMVDYIDAVDTGREAPRTDVPCFARIVEAMGQGLETAEQHHDAFLRAADVARTVLDGLVRGFVEVRENRDVVLRAMQAAVDAKRSVICFDRYVPWKPVYFENGGETHPTDYVLFPSEDETWKLVAIPPSIGQFEQKRPLPDSWAGKLADELEAATGVKGSLFCHKNRFIAVFETSDGAVDALKRFGLYEVQAAPDA